MRLSQSAGQEGTDSVRYLWWFRFFLLLLLLPLHPALAQQAASLPHTEVALVPETRAPKPGQAFTLALVVTPKSGWHTYWKYPGDAGIAPRARWTLPKGASASELQYPVPETFVVSGIMNHVYGSRNILLTDIVLPANFRGTLPIGVQLDWLVCNDRLCVPESARLSLALPGGNGAPDPAEKALFAAARHAMPRTLLEKGTFSMGEKNLRIAVPITGNETVTGAHFFPKIDDALLFAAPQSITRTQNALIIEAALAPGGHPREIPGLLRVERGSVVEGFNVVAQPGAVPAGEPLLKPAGSTVTVFATAFGAALLGGLILNLLPCVFPILSLKALSLARSGQSRTAARHEGLAYTAGVTLVTTALGGVVVALSRAGEGAGWAFQLQDPRVILVLLLLVLAIGLNFAGLFAVHYQPAAGSSLTEKPGAKGAFWTGALAAFVATPCTGPFMAGALGAALLLPPLAGVGVFAGLGLGLALPFLAVGFVPALQAWLPRPGAWMLTFRRILAIPMLLTALALAWVLGRQAGVTGLTIGLGFALLLGLALWWLGLRQAGRRAGVFPIMLALLGLVAAPLVLAAGSSAPPTQAEGALPSLPFSASRLATLRQQGTPVFLYFTADWCLTCKVNEHGALASPDVAESFHKKGIEVMVGDWTRPDPAIAHFLKAHGRAGIPFYLFYGKESAPPQELPQLLSVGMLTALGNR